MRAGRKPSDPRAYRVDSLGCRSTAPALSPGPCSHACERPACPHRGPRARLRSPRPRHGPNIVVLMTDDQTLDSMRVMPKSRDADRRPGRHLHQQLRQLLALLPVALDDLHRPVRPQPRRARQQAARRRLHPPRHLQLRCPLWLQRAGYRTMHVGKFLNGYGSDAPPSGPARVQRLARDGRPVDLQATTATRSTRTALRCATHPGDYSTDFIAAAADELIAAAAPAQAAVLHVGRVPRRRTAAGRATRTTRPASRRRRPRPKLQQRVRRAAPAQPATFNEADMSDKPHAIRRPPADRRRRRRADPGGLPAASSRRCWRSTTPSPRSSPRCARAASSTTR